MFSSLKRSLRAKLIVIFLVFMVVFMVVTILYAHSRSDARLSKYEGDVLLSLKSFVSDVNENPNSSKTFEDATDGLFSQRDEVVEVALKDRGGGIVFRRQLPLRPSYSLSFAEAYQWQFYVASSLADNASNPILGLFFPMVSEGFMEGSIEALGSRSVTYKVDTKVLQVWQALDHLQLYLFVWGGILICLMLCLYMLSLIRPIIAVRNGAVAIANGDFSQSVNVTRDDEIGTIAVFFNEVVRNLNQVAGELADKERIGRELELASTIQKDLIPKKAPIMPGLDIVARTKPAAEVGGDMYDFLEVDDANTLMCVGDVTGHGVPAGLVMTMVGVVLHAFAPIYRTTRDVLVHANAVLYPRIESTMFMTMVLLGWDSGRQKLTYSGAGHEHLLHYKAKDKKCEAIKTGGMAVGMMPSIEVIAKQCEVELSEDDVCVLFSDGIIEARNAFGEMYTLERLRSAVERYGSKGSAQEIFDAVTRDFSEFLGKNPNQEDDITLFIIRYEGIARETIGSVQLGVSKATKTSQEKWGWD